MPQTPHHRPTARRIREFARKMRRDPTDAETAMWRLLRDRRLAPFKFRRQVPFQNFILDFVCFERRIVIEIDGSQHATSERDSAREAILMAEGFRAARYWNNDVLLNPAGVPGGHPRKACRTVRTPHPSPNFVRRHPLPQGRGTERSTPLSSHDRLPHPSPWPDAFPQLSRGWPADGWRCGWCWSGRTAPARPIAWRRSRSCRRDAGCAAPRWRMSPTTRATVPGRSRPKSRARWGWPRSAPASTRPAAKVPPPAGAAGSTANR